MKQGKKCSDCKQSKFLSAFPFDGRRRDGHGSKCRDCCRRIQQEYYRRYPERERARRIKGIEITRRWYRRHHSSVLERGRWRRTEKLFGITKDKYQELLARQNGSCAICFSPIPGRKNKYFAIDHDHRTGKVRGLLCHSCNCGIGFFQDDPNVLERAREYVRTNG